MRTLAVVPARINSARLPDKNLQMIGGKTLVQHAVQQAHDSGVCDVVVVSSEIEHAADAVWIKRPPELHDGDLMKVITHALRELNDSFDAVVLLQPTSPFRTGNDIKECVKMLPSSSVDSVVSVTEAPPELAFAVRHAKRLELLPDVVVPNGAVYAIKTDAISAGLNWYNGYAYAYQMPKDRSLDIDTEQDLEIARMLWSKVNV